MAITTLSRERTAEHQRYVELASGKIRELERLLESERAKNRKLAEALRKSRKRRDEWHGLLMSFIGRRGREHIIRKSSGKVEG